jgi:hypothetical protein
MLYISLEVVVIIVSTSPCIIISFVTINMEREAGCLFLETDIKSNSATGV